MEQEILNKLKKIPLFDEIKENDKVSFEVGKGPKGPIALAVKKI